MLPACNPLAPRGDLGPLGTFHSQSYRLQILHSAGGFFCLVLFLLLLLLFWQCSRHAEVPSLGSNLCHSSGRSHSRDNARSLISRLPGNSSVCMFLFSSLFFSNGKGNKSSSIMVLMNRKGGKKRAVLSEKIKTLT